MENIYVVKMINSFPNLQEASVEITNTFTILKSGIATTFFVLLLVGFTLLLKQKLTISRTLVVNLSALSPVQAIP